jgi:DNA polymerase-1
MSVFAHYAERIARLADAPPPFRYRVPVPRCEATHAASLTVVDSADGARALADLARQLELSHVGFDTEFQYDRPGVPLRNKRMAYDPRSVRPLLLSLALAESGPKRRLYPFVIDLRRTEVLQALTTVLRLPVPFVGHGVGAELFCLWQHGLPEPRVVWDTWVGSRALALGRHHLKYALPGAGPGGGGPAAEARAGEAARAAEEGRHSLLAVCRRLGVRHAFAADKTTLQASFLSHPPGAPFTDRQLAYAAEDALTEARLYLPQVLRATRAGVLRHLETVEMPWAITNARMVWTGVRLDRAACRRVRDACAGHLAWLEPQLAAHGVGNVQSHSDLVAFFRRIGQLELFWRRGGYHFDKEALERFEHVHPAVPLIRAAKRVRQLRSDPVLWDALDGADGRVHPDHRQLGTDTGRQASWAPNILGLGKVFRPLVVPGTGRGIGEVDLSQIEVGLAAAVYHDAALVRMFNSGDAYAAMAQDFFRTELPPGDRDLPSAAFKKKHPGLRDRMKAATLGIIYGLTPHGLGLYLSVPAAEAARLQERFMALFPALRQALADAAAFGALAGSVPTATGLRRHRARRGWPSGWEKNWMTNHPVQGTAAALFKAAGNRLDRLYPAHDAALVVPLHDAFVFEAPLGLLSEVAALTERVMCETVQEHFPELRPRATATIGRPDCWNKDGRADSLERWLEDPTFSLDRGM